MQIEETIPTTDWSYRLSNKKKPKQLEKLMEFKIFNELNTIQYFIRGGSNITVRGDLDLYGQRSAFHYGFQNQQDGRTNLNQLYTLPTKSCKSVNELKETEKPSQLTTGKVLHRKGNRKILKFEEKT